MFNFFANIFGYLLEFIYNLVNSYGLAIILFTIIIKLILLPLSIKQQRSMKKNTEMSEKMKVLQFKYKNNPEKLNQEVMSLYKTEKMSPFSGCIIAIVQFILLISVFYMIKSPLTYMEKIPAENIGTYTQQLKEEGKVVSQVYPEIDIIREYNFLKEKNPEDTNIDKANIQMNFLGLDLSKIPQQNVTDFTVYIIPVLYIISSFVSIRMNNAMQEKQKNEQKEIRNKLNKENSEKTTEDIEKQDNHKENDKNNDNDEENKKEENAVIAKEEVDEIDSMAQTNKMMSWMMPIMAISIAFVAPLGLALYWLISNVLTVLERILLDKIVK